MSGADDERWTEYMDLSEIQMAPRNPKLHATDEIAGSISHFGLAELPLLDERTERLVAGHGRIIDLRTRQAAGEAPPAYVRADGDRWLVPINRGWSSRSDEDAEAYLAASNNLTMLGGWDNPMLAVMLDELRQKDMRLIELAGFSDGDVDDMLKLLEPPDLDQLGKDLGDPDASDNWPIIRVKVPKHVAAAWRSHADTYNGDEPAALAALLQVDIDDPGESDWTP